MEMMVPNQWIFVLNDVNVQCKLFYHTNVKHLEFNKCGMYEARLI